jgi:hypothetical protein
MSNEASAESGNVFMSIERVGLRGSRNRGLVLMLPSRRWGWRLVYRGLEEGKLVLRQTGDRSGNSPGMEGGTVGYGAQWRLSQRRMHEMVLEGHVRRPCSSRKLRMGRGGRRGRGGSRRGRVGVSKRPGGKEGLIYELRVASKRKEEAGDRDRVLRVQYEKRRVAVQCVCHTTL